MSGQHASQAKGSRDISVFDLSTRAGSVLVMQVLDFDSSWRKLDSDPTNLKWQREMAEYFEPVPDLRPGERFAMMNEVSIWSDRCARRPILSREISGPPQGRLQGRRSCRTSSIRHDFGSSKHHRSCLSTLVLWQGTPPTVRQPGNVR